jgi:CheY-like chemotaxis protein
MFTDVSPRIRVLVVDDDPDIRSFVGHVLKSAGCEVHFAVNGEQALDRAIVLQPELVLLDINLPLQDGWLVCAKLKLIEPSPDVVLMTGLDCDDLDRFSEFVKATDVLRKPFSAEDLLRKVPCVPA